jgi:hypothetical protein
LQNETIVSTSKRLGRRKPSNKPALRLARLLTGQTPTHPLAANNLLAVQDFGLYKNDQFGVCGPTMVANGYKVTTKQAGAELSVSQNDVFDLYRRSGNPNFDPNTDQDDNGVDLQTMFEEVHKNGLAGIKSLAFAKVDISNLNEVKAAIDIFGVLYLGVNLQTAQQSQTDTGLWDFDNSSEWGGHAVLAGKYTNESGNDIGVISWAEHINLTDTFWEKQVEEAWIVIWPEYLTMPEFDSSIDLEQLSIDYKELTGNNLPLVDPVPVKPEENIFLKLIADIKDTLKKIEAELKKLF